MVSLSTAISPLIITNKSFSLPSAKLSKLESTRSFISPAALLVKVIANIFWKVKISSALNNTFRYSFTSVKVFPLPAEAL